MEEFMRSKLTKKVVSGALKGKRCCEALLNLASPFSYYPCERSLRPSLEINTDRCSEILVGRCGHCANLLSVNMGALLQTVPTQDLQISLTLFLTVHNEAAPEKRQRVPSAYNRFIKEEIQRIKASNPDITHREAFSTAAKNWAHFPHIHFGLKLDGNKQGKLDQAFAGEGPHKAHGFY
uniref:Axial regulator YABBY 2 n=1 Tax=Vitis vinifera TaxID=29760 RepID=A5BXB3_VITVI|nr:hypothetical protein VITISV_008108 [Vitis vinifera]